MSIVMGSLITVDKLINLVSYDEVHDRPVLAKLLFKRIPLVSDLFAQFLFSVSDLFVVLKNRHTLLEISLLR